MRYIRRKIITDIAGSPIKQKAVAFAMLMKRASKESSVIRHFTVYKLHKLSCNEQGKGGMAYKTIRKYLDVLFKMELAEVMDGDLYIKRLASKSKHRNIDISSFELDTSKNIFNEIRDLLFLVVQAHKDYVLSLLRLRRDPSWDTDYKKVRRLCKKCCNDPNAEYKEYGLSYRRIARQLGCCARTAFKVVGDTIGRQWCTKTNRCAVVELPNVNYKDVPGYSFTTQHHGFIIRSNTFTLSNTWYNYLVDNNKEFFSQARKEVG